MTNEALRNDNVVQLTALEDRLYRDAFENAPLGMAQLLPGGRFLRANRRLADLLGYAEADLRHLSLMDITHPADAAPGEDPFKRLQGGECDSVRLERRLKREDQQYVWTQLTGSLKRTASGQPDYLIAIVEDVTERKRVELLEAQTAAAMAADNAAQAEVIENRNRTLRTQINRLLDSERKLKQTEHHLQSVTDNLPTMVSYWNRDSRCEFANKACRSIFTIPPHRKMAEMTMRQLMGDALFKLSGPYVRLTMAGELQRFQATLKKKDGSTTVLNARYVPDLDERGVATGFFMFMTDASSKCASAESAPSA